MNRIYAILLAEGKIEVSAEGEKPVTMDQARQFYRREKGQTQAVGFVSSEQIVEWSKETEIEAGKGAASTASPSPRSLADWNEVSSTRVR